MKYGIVITTINYPGEFLTGYRKNFEKYGHMDDVTVYLIPDKKTPPLQNIPREWPDNFVLPDLDAQVRFVKTINGNPEFFPYNSDRRRNSGYLMAMSDNCDIVISLDDDNYCKPDVDYLAEHSQAMQDSNNAFVWGGWVNPGMLLDCSKHIDIYARGFPYAARKENHRNNTWLEDVKIRVNAGLWEEQPDMDAMSWLHTPVRDAVFNPDKRLVLSHNTLIGGWAPICSQNTAVHRDLMPAYYFLGQGRYGDIFQGYFMQAVMKKFKYNVRFGSPAVTHKRNSHNYFKDMVHEHEYIVRLEKLLPELINVQLSGSTVAEVYLSLAGWLIENNLSKSDVDSYALVDSGLEMQQWIKMCKNIGVTV